MLYMKASEISTQDLAKVFLFASQPGAPWKPYPHSVKIIRSEGKNVTEEELTWPEFLSRGNVNSLALQTPQGPVTGLVFTGAWQPPAAGGWDPPARQSISCGADEISMTERVTKLTQSAAKGDAAKMLSRLHAILTKAKRQKLRDKLIVRINGSVGSARFMAKQLDMMAAVPGAFAEGNMQQRLGLVVKLVAAEEREAEAKAWADAAEGGMQKRARNVLREVRERVVGALSGKGFEGKIERAFVMVLDGAVADVGDGANVEVLDSAVV